MEFIDLKEQYRRLKPQISARIDAVLEHGNFILGPEIAELEKELAALAGVKHCISCASGTDALIMPLMAWGVGPGDAVFVPPFTFFATAEVVSMLGATPVFVDVEEASFNMDPAALERAIKAVLANDPSIHPLPAVSAPLRPKAIIPVDMFGQAADYPQILAIAGKYGLKTIEDAAQSCGGSRFGQANGGQGADCAGTSFFPAKPLGCYGDGGAIFTDDCALAAVLQSIRVHGKGSHKYENVRIGLNGRLDTLQAAILLPKLAVLPEEIKARQEVAARYGKLLQGLPGVIAPVLPEGCTSAWAQYTIRLTGAQRDAVAAALAKEGVPTAVYYPKPLHVQTVFNDLRYKEEDFPVSARLCREVLSLPMHPYLDEAMQIVVVDALKKILGQ